eukprot:8280135-Pyramimonas_sp.AAC.1
MKTHFELNGHLCETYEDLKREIRKHVGSKSVWNEPYGRQENGPKPMEVDASKGYPKGTPTGFPKGSPK